MKPCGATPFGGVPSELPPSPVLPGGRGNDFGCPQTRCQAPTRCSPVKSSLSAAAAVAGSGPESTAGRWPHCAAAKRAATRTAASTAPMIVLLRILELRDVGIAVEHRAERLFQGREPGLE